MQANELQEINEELIAQQTQLENMAVEVESSNEELSAANTALEERTFDAEEANRAKAEFLRNMSHELRTPLNAIGGYIELLELGVHGPVNAQQRAYLERVREAGRHLLMLITDTLSFAKIQAGKVQLQATAVPLNRIMREAEQFAQPMLQSKQIAFATDGRADDIDVAGDPDRIRQILINLLSNAVKYTATGGEVGLFAEADSEAVCIRVRDNGPGVPMEMQESIFDPFVQFKHGRGALNDGVGLGLAISRELARAMNGDLSLDSNPGSGSTFTLLLPEFRPRPHSIRL